MSGPLNGDNASNGVDPVTKETYFGVYRVLKDGRHKYVSRSATSSQRLAESLAADLTRGDVVTPTGRVARVRAFPHIAKAIGAEA
jgi:hypothetical protein